MLYYYNCKSKTSSIHLKARLVEMLSTINIQNQHIIILCIGSDRSTGDSLGPLIGYKLEQYDITGITVIGTLERPVHAANLSDTLTDISRYYEAPFIIAIDASLGKKEHIGYITLGPGSLKPGLGVNKNLPEVGDIHITGIVNYSGVMDSLLLQTTRLNTIMHLADTISMALAESLAFLTSSSYKLQEPVQL